MSSPSPRSRRSSRRRPSSSPKGRIRRRPRDPGGGVPAVAGAADRQLAQRRLRPPGDRDAGHRGGRGMGRGPYALMGTARLRGAVRIRARLVARTLPRAPDRAAGDADHRLPARLDARHERYGIGRGRSRRRVVARRPGTPPGPAARQDRAGTGAARRRVARRRPGAADGRPAGGSGASVRRAVAAGGQRRQRAAAPEPTCRRSSGRRASSRCSTGAAILSRVGGRALGSDLVWPTQRPDGGTLFVGPGGSRRRIRGRSSRPLPSRSSTTTG